MFSCFCQKWFFRFVLALSWLGKTAFPAYSTHLAGGDIAMGRDSPNVVTFILTVYRDEINGLPALPPSELVTIYQKYNLAQVQQITVTRASIDTVPYLRPDCSAGIVSTTRHTYVANIPDNQFITLNHPGGYVLEYRRAARNNIISNLINSGSTLFTVITEVPPFFTSQGVRIINNTPIFNNALGDIACLFEPYSFNSSAIDVDGDSLVYSFSHPLNGITAGSFINVVFTPGFGLNNLLQGSPTLTINPSTGIMSATPNLQGVFTFVVAVTEFRNAVLLGRTTREFQLLVTSCGSPVNDFTPIIKVEDVRNNTFYQPGDTLDLDSTTGKCLRVRVIDQDPSSEITFQAILLNGPLSLLSPIVQIGLTNSSNNPSDTVNFNVCINLSRCVGIQDSILHIRLTSSDRSCLAGNNRDTLLITVRVNFPADTAAIPVTLSTNLPGNVVSYYRGTTPQVSLFVASAGGTNLRLQLLEDSISLAFLFPSVNILTGSSFFQFPYSWASGCRPLSDFPDTIRLLFRVSDQECNISSDTLTVFFVIRRDDSGSFLELLQPVPSDTVYIGQKHDFIIKVNSPQQRRSRLTLLYDRDIVQKLRVFFANDIMFDQDIRWFSFTPPCSILDNDSVVFRFQLVEETGPCARSTDTLRVVYYIREINTPPSTRIINSQGNTVSDITIPQRALIDFEVIGNDPDIMQQLKQSGSNKDGSELPPWVLFSPGSGREAISGKLILDPSCDISQPGTYAFAFITQDNSCKAIGDSVILNITLTLSDSLEGVPNFITPNGDGFNDSFTLADLQGICGFEEFTIFNRWGRKVFVTTDPEFVWNAEDESPGQYFYSLIASKNTYSGYISVLK